MKVAVLLVLAFVVAVLSAPSPPVWPSGFSSTVSIVNASDPNPYDRGFFRYFVDIKQNAALVRGVRQFGRSPPVFWYQYTLGAEKLEYHVFVNLDDNQISCYTRPQRFPIVAPTFTGFQYGGQAIIRGALTDKLVNQWLHPNRTQGTLSEYFDDAFTREPARFTLFYEDQYGNREEEVWTYHEIDVAAQDPAVFVVPANVKPVCQPAK